MRHLQTLQQQSEQILDRANGGTCPIGIARSSGLPCAALPWLGIPSSRFSMGLSRLPRSRTLRSKRELRLPYAGQHLTRNLDGFYQISYVTLATRLGPSLKLLRQQTPSV